MIIFKQFLETRPIGLSITFNVLFNCKIREIERDTGYLNALVNRTGSGFMQKNDWNIHKNFNINIDGACDFNKIDDIYTEDYEPLL
jgi:hypothetical protein